MLILTIVTISFNGTTKADQVAVIGAGLSSCGTWTAARSKNQDLVYTSWTNGFLSGIGFMGGPAVNPLNGVDANGVWGWIDNYCRAHPIEKIMDAAKAFYYAHPH